MSNQSKLDEAQRERMNDMGDVIPDAQYGRMSDVGPVVITKAAPDDFEPWAGEFTV